MSRRRPAALLLALAAAGAVWLPAAAYADPGGDAGDPKAVDALPRPFLPTEVKPEWVRIMFDAPVADIDGHSIEVTDATGERVDDGDVRREGQAGLAVGVDAAEPGLYIVRYSALVQGHEVRGEYNFAFQPPAQPEPEPSSGAWLGGGALTVGVAVGGSIALRHRRAAQAPR